MTPGVNAADNLLEARDLAVSYGAVRVLFGVSIDVPRGSRVALLGTNGAGKSTLLKAVSGLLKPDAGTNGSVWFDGDNVTALPPEARVARGMVQIGGGRATFPSLSVEENLKIGAYPFLGQTALVAERTAEVLDVFPNLRTRLRERAGNLSGGEQQMVALGRALIAGPKLLMIDELSLGLAPVVMQQIMVMIDEFSRRGTTMLIVEQSLNVAVSLASHAYFMEKGEIRYSGSTDALMESGDIVRSVFFGAPGSPAKAGG